MKIHKKVFISKSLNFIFSVISPKLQGVSRRNFRSTIRKIQMKPKKYTTSGCTSGAENVIDIRGL